MPPNRSLWVNRTRPGPVSDQSTMLPVEDAGHEEMPEPLQLAPGLRREHRRAERHRTLALGFHPDLELRAGLRPRLDLLHERVPIGVRRQVHEHVPDLLGSGVELAWSVDDQVGMIASERPHYVTVRTNRQVRVQHRREVLDRNSTPSH